MPVVILRGPLFTKNIRGEVAEAVIGEAMNKIEERVRRPGRKLGRKNNPIGPGQLARGTETKLVMESSLNWPRTVGTSWTNKNMAAINAMAPRVLRSVAKKIVENLG